MSAKKSVEQFKECTECNLCFASCEMYQGISPSLITGLAHELSEGLFSPQRALEAYRCTLCGFCETVCPLSLNLSDLFLAARIQHNESGRGPLVCHEPLLVNRRVNLFTLYNARGRRRRQYPKQARRIFFPGCSMSAFRPDLIPSLNRVVGDALTLDFECCGKPLRAIGATETYRKHQAVISGRIASLAPEELLVACPNCHNIFEENRGGAKLVYVAEPLLEQLRTEGFRSGIHVGTVAVQDPCPFKDDEEMLSLTRRFIDTVYTGERVEMKYSRRDQKCCGAGGAANFAYEEIAKELSRARLEDAKNSGADSVMTFCVSCAVQLGSVSNEMGMKVLHAFDLLSNTPPPDYAAIYRKSREVFSGPRTLVNALRLTLQV